MITRVQISLQHFKFISSGHVCSSVIAESWAVVFLILEGNFILLSVMALINTPNLLYNNNSFFHIITDILSFVQPTLQQEFLSSHYHRHAVFCHLDCVHPNSWKVTHRSFNTRCVIRDMYIFFIYSFTICMYFSTDVFSGAGDMARYLSVSAAQSRDSQNQKCFLQMPETPALRDPMPSSDLHTYKDTHTYPDM